MSSPETSSRASPKRRPPPPPVPSSSPVRHPRSFKLRFAAQRVPGHSNQSAVRPLKLPAVVTDKFWRRTGREEAMDEESEQRALDKVQAMFQMGPREKHERPVQSSHEYGWWESYAPQIWAAPRNDRRLHHGLRDSAWLKLRARELVEPPQRKR
ncbi:uncharacterized protein LOC125226151 [Leguminivora glycinivorella]|uniref:uncharacterized protein LOC125226151 n=1 Tax=Leguminivora glycinivorella TaxID=1035111 RepID=UPI00200F4C81|nr:uncharacterized protein LOC125226151 [Leguminivora glycinivorella]